MIQILCIIFLFPAFLVCAYNGFLAVWALITKQKQKPINEKARHSFAIVIPAHNEEKGISQTLKSCTELDYPIDNYKVFVVADNCSDLTAKIAVQNGVVCLERHDDKHKGKGFALAWAFKRILPEGQDALIILDADCYLEPHTLKIFDHYLTKGDKVLQANFVNSNPDVNSTSYAVSVGNLIEKDLFYAPKSHLGLAVFLQGIGMVFHREVLQQQPWEVYSNTEDVEYTLKLFSKKISVKFIDEVRIKTKSPAHIEQLKIQRKRWVGGNANLGKTYAIKLIWEGLIKKRWLLLDAGWTLLILSRPLVLFELCIAMILAGISTWIFPGTISCILFAAGIALILFYALYFGLGIILLGVNARRMMLLINSPAVVIRLIIITLFGFLKDNKEIWIRTPR